jgi:hypothetical protein
MSAAPGHDLSDLIKWTARDEWRSRVDAAIVESFEPTVLVRLAFEQIGDSLGGTSAMS